MHHGVSVGSLDGLSRPACKPLQMSETSGTRWGSSNSAWFASKDTTSAAVNLRGRGVARGDGPGEEVKVRKEQEEEEEEEEEEEQEEEEQEEEEGYTLSLLC